MVMEVSGSRLSEMSECIIRYEWKNKNSSLRERYEKNEEGENMCEWNESVIVLKNNVKFVMKRCEVNGSRSGGISVNGGDVNVSECIFEGTYEEKEGFESVRHNVICSNEGNVTMNRYNGESITKNTSLWIVIGDCRFETSEEEPESVLYVPILEGVRYNDSDATLTFYGEMMIRCNMSYKIAYSNGSRYMVEAVSLSGASNENETFISANLSTALAQDLSYSAQVIYGINRSTGMRKILWPGEEYEEGMSEESNESRESGSGEKEGEGEGGGGGDGREVKRGEGGGSSKGTVIGVVIVIIVLVVGGGGGCVGVYVMKKKREKEREEENNMEMRLSTGLLDSGEEREGGEKGEERRREEGEDDEKSKLEYSGVGNGTGMNEKINESTVNGEKGSVSSDIQVLVAD